MHTHTSTQSLSHTHSQLLRLLSVINAGAAEENLLAARSKERFYGRPARRSGPTGFPDRSPALTFRHSYPTPSLSLSLSSFPRLLSGNELRIGFLRADCEQRRKIETCVLPPLLPDLSHSLSQEETQGWSGSVYLLTDWFPVSFITPRYLVCIFIISFKDPESVFRFPCSHMLPKAWRRPPSRKLICRFRGIPC